MRIVQIPKRSGGYRRIYIPDDVEDENLRHWLPHLNKAAEEHCRAAGDAAHGFRPGRNAVTNALAHAGQPWVACMDLADWYDSVTESQLRGLVPQAALDACLVDGAPRQGLCTSPALANIAGSVLDKAALKGIKKKSLGDVVYTRYADDITVSAKSLESLRAAVEIVRGVVQRMGWKLNKRKLHIQPPHLHKRITGVVLSPDGTPRASRELRRIARAAEHQSERRDSRGRGVQEWCKMKTPRAKLPDQGVSAAWRSDLQSYARRRHIPARIMSELAARCTEELAAATVVDGNFTITADPIYAVEPTSYSRGWTSCLRYGGGHYPSTLRIASVAGLRIAALLADSEATVHGVTRRQMLARALVWIMRNGRRYYDRVYGGEPHAKQLREWLESQGVQSIVQAARGSRVAGRVMSKQQPWLDTLRCVRARFRGQRVYLLEV